MKRRRLLMAVAGSPLCAPAAQAQGWPSRPIRWINSYAPGGGTDVVSRALAAQLSRSLGQPVVVENRTGHSGNLGMDLVAKAVPDGYTLGLCGTGSHFVNPTLYSAAMPFDVLRDFTGIARTATWANVLVVHPSVAARSVAELVTLAKRDPGGLFVGSAGIGTSQHLAAVIFGMETGVTLTHVPFRGSSAAMPEILAGRVGLMFSEIPAARPHIASGALIALGQTAATRSTLLPDVPTIAESGVPGFDVFAWTGCVAPAGLPHPILARLEAAVRDALASAEVRDRLLGIGIEPAFLDAREFDAFLRDGVERWAPIVRTSGARPE